MIHPFPPPALRRRHAQTVKDSSSSCKIDSAMGIKNFLIPKEQKNCMAGSRVKDILLKGWILPIGEVHREGSAPAACPAGLFSKAPGLCSSVELDQRAIFPRAQLLYWIDVQYNACCLPMCMISFKYT